MHIIGFILNIVGGLGIFCSVLFALATQLPFFIGITVGVGVYSFQAGAGPFGAIVFGFAMAGFTFVDGQYAHTIARSPILRLACAIRCSGGIRGL